MDLKRIALNLVMSLVEEGIKTGDDRYFRFAEKFTELWVKEFNDFSYVNHRKILLKDEKKES